jgi:DNA (cytosine-5)-methyltransferase 1
MQMVVQPAVPYDLFQITAPINRQNRDERSPCHTLARDNAAHAAVVQPLAFDARQRDVCVYGDKTGPLDTDPGTIGVCVTGDRTHAPAIHFDVYNHKTTGDVCGIVREQHGTNMNAVLQPSMSVRRLTPTECERLQGFEDAICFEPRYYTRENKTGGAPSPTATLTAGTKVGDSTPHVVHTSMSVRRLTPTECERLQGFPDGWTAIPWKGKPVSECPDGPRYRALGNSMAVNVMRWIGRRIELVEKT